ncbi:MAG: putative bifunctional diguanylate cyclase/phosphodiesterase, partial [Acidimicrobiales bacterium]
LTYLLWTLGAATVAVVCSRRLPRPVGRPWRWVAFGLVCSGAGDAYYALHAELAPPIPDISAADPAWLASYPFVGAALFLLLHERGTAFRDDIEGLIDTCMAIVVSSLVLWQLAVQPLLDDRSLAPLTRAVWSSYPVLDAVLFALVMRTLLSRRARSSVSLLLGAGTLCWMVADVGSLFFEWTGVPLALMDAGWMIGAALLSAATWRAAHQPSPERADVTAAAESRLRPVPAWQLALGFAPLVIPAVLEVVADQGGRDQTVLLLGGTAAIAALTFARSVHTLRNREEAERRLVSSERHFRALAVNSADAVLVLDGRGRITQESSRLADLIDFGGRSLCGINALEAVYAQDAEAAQAMFDRVKASPGTVFDGELRVHGPRGSRPWLAVRAVNLLDDPDVRGIVVNFHDITDRKTAEAELTYLAFHDTLTGLANRGLFHDRVEHALEVREGPSIAVLFLDLDGFKDVNDGYGHETGDALLSEVATRLVRASRAEDTVARLGGDEFAILVERADDAMGAAVAIAERILAELTAPVLLDAGLVTLSASIGVATAERGSSASSILRDADIAMYEAKAAGRGRWVAYEPAMLAATLERLRLDQDLATALELNQLWVAYQPVVDLETGAIVGFEALLRWDHPSLGVISPDRFISIAEESGLIIPIGRWILETACRTVASWQRTYPAFQDLTVAVNISGRQLASSDLVSHVEDALASSGLAARSLVLEMTESVLVDDSTAAAGRLRQLRRLGLRLAIDDFGTGYSSLSYLRQFPIDILKLDRSFVSLISGSEAVPALVRGLIELGHTLDLELIAEGIEHHAQLVHLRHEHCHLGQGYLFAMPAPAAEAELLLLGVLKFPLVAPSSTSLVPLGELRERETTSR